MTGLVLSEVSLSYADGDEQVHALDHVSLTVAPGELVAVSGASGSGKSSLLAVAGALRTPDSGQVLIGGTDVTPRHPVSEPRSGAATLASSSSSRTCSRR